MEAGGAAFHSGANSIPIIPANGMLSPNRTRILNYLSLMTRTPSYLGGYRTSYRFWHRCPCVSAKIDVLDCSSDATPEVPQRVS